MNLVIQIGPALKEQNSRQKVDLKSRPSCVKHWNTRETRLVSIYCSSALLKKNHANHMVFLGRWPDFRGQQLIQGLKD